MGEVLVVEVGKYRTRNGMEVEVIEIDNNPLNSYDRIGYYISRRDNQVWDTWTINGRIGQSKDDLALVERIKDNTEELNMKTRIVHEFDLEKYNTLLYKVETKGGKEVKILDTEYKNDGSGFRESIIIKVNYGEGKEFVETYYKNGSYRATEPSRMDLVLIEEVEVSYKLGDTFKHKERGEYYKLISIEEPFKQQFTLLNLRTSTTIIHRISTRFNSYELSKIKFYEEDLNKLLSLYETRELGIKSFFDLYEEVN